MLADSLPPADSSLQVGDKSKEDGLQASKSAALIVLLVMVMIEHGTIHKKWQKTAKWFLSRGNQFWRYFQKWREDSHTSA